MVGGNDMDIFEFAIKMEKDGEIYYKQLGEKSEDTGLRSICFMLAEDEKKHSLTLQKMKESSGVEMEDTNILGQSKNVFQLMKEDEAPVSTQMSQLDMYHTALELEKQSMEFYREKAGESDHKEHRATLLKIAEEENKHYKLIENIIQYISRPQQWIEDAEFTHLDEY